MAVSNAGHTECSRCPYYARRGDRSGECRANPPVVRLVVIRTAGKADEVVEDRNAVWPIVQASDSCGLHPAVRRAIA